MNKLLAQIAKFGLVGVICFIIDYVVYRIFNVVFEATGIATAFPQYYLVSAFFGFCVSVVCNYILSFKFVFERKEDMSRKKEFTIFLILSIIGLGINELCLWLGIDVIYQNWTWLKGIMSESFAKDIFFKFGATGVVMVYNFITRKIFLEKK
jgi:putative flippase GtrA